MDKGLGEPPSELLEEQQRLRDEVQRLRDEQQRLRDEQQKLLADEQAVVAPQEQTKDQQNQGQLSGDEPIEPKKKRGVRPLTLLILLIVLSAVVVGGFFLWGYLNSYESTDDAQIDGHLNSVSSRISGTVTNVYVDDNQFVKAGQVLVNLDTRDYQVALEQAQADLEQAKAEVGAQTPNVPITSTTAETTISTANLDVAAALAKVASAQQNYAATQAQIRQAQANHFNDVAEVARFKALVDKDEVSRQQYDTKVTTAKASEAAVESAQASAEAARKQIEQAQAEVDQARARSGQARQNAPRQIAVQKANSESKGADVLAKKAAVDQALLNLQYCKIVAPVDGIVGKKNVEVGTRVSPGQELMAVVPLDDIWVTANFKETQLRRMRPGQRVTIKVDAFARTYGGYVESVAAASGAKFSLLPPENATGNFVKVVQRIPVRIRFNKTENEDRKLRPGMSVEPKVWLQ